MAVERITDIVNEGEALGVVGGVAASIPIDGGAVDSVNGETGTVVLSAADVGARASGVDIPVADIDATGTPSATTYLRGNGTWSTPVATPAPFSGAKAVRSTAQTITNSVEQAVSWTVESYDAGGWFDLGQPTRLTVVTTGYVRIATGIKWDSNATGIRVLHIQKNGTTTIASSQHTALADITHGITVDDQATAGDFYVVNVFQNSGASRTLGGAVNTFACIQSLGS